MRHCDNESVEVYETVGEELAPLLREVADLVENHNGWSQVLVGLGLDTTYLVTVYLH